MKINDINHRQALDQTLTRYRITGKALCEATGIQEKQISNFKNGKSDLTTESFFKLVNALPDNAREYFYKSLYSGQAQRSLTDMIETANDDEIGEVLIAVGKKWKREMMNGRKETSISTEKITDAIAV